MRLIKLQNIYLLLFFLFFSDVFILNADRYFIDQRDGKKYKTVEIDGVVWLAQNFSYKIEDSWIYQNKPENEAKYGRLYTWESAINACPKGWHLPSDKEWKKLERFLSIGKKDLDSIDYRIPLNKNKYKRFKKEFNIIMSGCRKHENGDFIGLDSWVFYWTSSSYKKKYAWKRAFDINEPGIGRHTFNKKNGSAVRYIKD